jgi:hypothetical protein
MATVLKPGWSKPSTILFASEIPANEKAFAFALAQAVEFGAELILFHAYDTLVVSASESSAIRYYDYCRRARDRDGASGAAGQTRPGCGRKNARRWCGRGWPPTRFSPSCASGRLTALSWAPTLRAPSASCWWARWPRPCCAWPSAGLHRRSRGGGRRVSQLCHPHHSVRRQPA